MTWTSCLLHCTEYKDSLTGSDVEFQYIGQLNSPKSVWGSWNNHAVSLWLRSMFWKTLAAKTSEAEIITSLQPEHTLFSIIEYQIHIRNLFVVESTRGLQCHCLFKYVTSSVYGAQGGWTVKTIKTSIVECAQGSSVLCKLWDAVQHEEKSDSSTDKLKLPSSAKQCLNTRRTLWDSQLTHYIKKGLMTTS